jgi:HEPN domain-containing protein
MKKLTAEWIKKAEADFVVARNLLNDRPIYSDQVCFHCQQAIEKFLKASLHEAALAIPRTHDITGLIDLLVPADHTWRSYRRGTRTLTRYAVDYRYPGLKPTTRQARAAFQKATLFRDAVRLRLEL